MKLVMYEIQIGKEWFTVKGTTSGLKEGWLSWRDNEGSSGMSRPGTWRKKEKGTSTAT